MCKELKMQPTLIHVQTEKDVVYTPRWLAQDMVNYFSPTGVCLDPCRGGGAFYDLLPAGSDWCEIELGRDFYTWNKPVDWCIGNPPYSHLLAWIRHSFTFAEDIVYLVPLHRVVASDQFLQDLERWGGMAEIRHYGTGSSAGFPFGHALAAVHFKRGYRGGIKRSRFEHDGRDSAEIEKE